MHIHYIYARGLLYMPPRVLALWGQNPAGAKTVQMIYFEIKTHNFFIIFTFFCKNIERVKMTTIFKYFMFGKCGCLDTNARGCCMHVFLVYTNTQEFSANNISTNLFCVSIQSRPSRFPAFFQHLSLLRCLLSSCGSCSCLRFRLLESL